LWKPLQARAVFGGQVVGLALAAALKTVDTNLFRVHSLHCYFLLAGDNTTPIIYHVKRMRDGQTYCTRQVTARQRGRDIFVTVVSFQKQEPSRLIHAYPLPKVPPPEQVKSIEDKLKEWLEDPRVPVKYHRSIKLRLQQVCLSIWYRSLILHLVLNLDISPLSLI
jgi:acyl-CoA thioesterase 8